MIKDFKKDTLKRTIHTMCECFLGLVGGYTLFSPDMDWKVIASSVVFSGVITVIKCVSVATEVK